MDKRRLYRQKKRNRLDQQQDYNGQRNQLETLSAQEIATLKPEAKIEQIALGSNDTKKN